MIGMSIIFEDPWAIDDPPRLVCGPYATVFETSSGKLCADGGLIAWRSRSGAWCTVLTVMEEAGRCRSGIVAFRGARIVGVDAALCELSARLDALRAEVFREGLAWGTSGQLFRAAAPTNPAEHIRLIFSRSSERRHTRTADLLGADS